MPPKSGPSQDAQYVSLMLEPVRARHLELATGRARSDEHGASRELLAIRKGRLEACIRLLKLLYASAFADGQLVALVRLQMGLEGRYEVLAGDIHRTYPILDAFGHRALPADLLGDQVGLQILARCVYAGGDAGRPAADDE